MCRPTIILSLLLFALCFLSGGADFIRRFGDTPQAALASVASAASLSVSTPPQCQTQESARRGFVLVRSDGHRRVKVLPSNDDYVSYSFDAPKSSVTLKTYKGLYTIKAVTFAGESTFTYDFDYTQEPQGKVGDQHTYYMTQVKPGGEKEVTRVYRRITREEEVFINPCIFKTLVVESTFTAADANVPRLQVPETRANYSPLLRMIVHAAYSGAPVAIPDLAYARLEELK